MAEQEEHANSHICVNSDAVVTMVDVLKEQEDFEENANAVLGASDDKNCTYQKGYVKRQALYACLTCCSDSKTDATKRAGLCLACSLTCHENHELVELYTKRNFRCDCGGPKFNSHPCQFAPPKRDPNNENKYNQNFSGIYCICHKPYPDPEANNEEEMIQCVICEDWLHTGHLEAKVPANDQYSEMICKQCMDSHCFLDDYIECAVNADNDTLDNSDLDILNSSGVNTDKMDDFDKSITNNSISGNEEMELGNKMLVHEDINEQQLGKQNSNEQKEVNTKSDVQEIVKSQVDGEDNYTSSEQLMDTVQVHIDDEKSVNKKDNPDDNEIDNSGDNEKDNPGDNEKDNPGDNEKDKPGDNDKDKPGDNDKDKPADNEKDKTGDINPSMEAYSQITELRETKQGDDIIPMNNVDDANPNTENFFQNKDFKETNQTENIIANVNPDDPNPNVEIDSQNEEFRETNQVDDMISNDKDKEITPYMETASHNEEFRETNQVVDVVCSENNEIQTQATVENKSTSDPGSLKSKETVSEGVDAPRSEQKEEESCTGDEIVQENLLKVDITDTKYVAALTSEKSMYVNTTVVPDVKGISSSQNDKLDNMFSAITDEKGLETNIISRDTETFIAPEKTQLEGSSTILPQHEDNGDSKEEVNDVPITIIDKVEKNNVIEPLSATLQCDEGENSEQDYIDNSTKTEEVGIKSDCKLLDIEKKVNKEFVVTSNTNDLERSNEENSNIDDKTQTAADDTKKCDNVNKDIVGTGEKDKQEGMDIGEKGERANSPQEQDEHLLQVNEVSPKRVQNHNNEVEFKEKSSDNTDTAEHMDVDEKEERASPAQEQDEHLLHVNEVSPKTVQNNTNKEEFKEKSSENPDTAEQCSPQNVEINKLEKQADLEVSISSECKPDNVVSMSDDKESLVKNNNQIEGATKNREEMVAESMSVQKCTEIGDKNITECQEHKDSGESATADNNDIEMNDSVLKASDAKTVGEVTSSYERMNEDISESVETKTETTISGNDGWNVSDIAKTEKGGKSDINSEANGNTLDVSKTISEDVEMADIESTACTIRCESENGLQLDNTEKSIQKNTECKIQETSLETSPTCDSQSIKRKQDSENHMEGKKIKIEADVDVCDTSESSQCFRPHKPKNGHKGATFWPCSWRKKLCSCFNCVAMYRNNDVLFLIDAEDTVSAYEDLGKSTNANSQYAKGLEALSSLDRIQQINAITEYNKMKEKLLDFLKSFKDKREVVKEEDIKEFFAGMKPRREPDGVYFCR